MRKIMRNKTILSIYLIGFFSILTFVEGVAFSATAEIWEELNGSGSGNGISAGASYVGGPSVAVNNEGKILVGYTQYHSGVWDVRAKFWDGSSWVDLGYLTNTDGDATQACAALTSSGTKIIAWRDYYDVYYYARSEIYVAYHNGSSWQGFAGSNTFRGISSTDGGSYDPTLVVNNAGQPIVAWDDNTNGNKEIYLLCWNGSSWISLSGSDIGGGISRNDGSSKNPSLCLDSNDRPVVAWQDNTSGNYEIYVRRWNGSAWEGLNGSASSGGISSNTGESEYPSICSGIDGQMIVAWQDDASGNKEIYAKRWNGSFWESLDSSATGGGISDNTGKSEHPSLTIDASGHFVVAWQDNTSSDYEIYVKSWNGVYWGEKGTGSASGGGISNDSDNSRYASVASNSAKVFVGWSGPQIYLRYTTDEPLPPTKKRLIIDTDPAVGDSDPDDGTAIIYAFQSPDLCTIEGITYGYGNFGNQIPDPNGTRGANRMLDYYQLQLNKIIEVLRESGAIENDPNLYRGHKKSETWDNNPNPPSNSAAEFIRDTVRDNPGQISVIALGTLTNIATAIASYPDGSGSDPNGFMRDCRELWIIGGGIGLGNVFDPCTLSFFSAEFNIWRDRIATEYVLLHAIKNVNGVPKIKMVPLNATWRMLIDSHNISQFENDANPRLSNYLAFPMRWWIDEVHPLDCRQLDMIENGALAVARGYNYAGGQTPAVWLPGLIALGINFFPLDLIGLNSVVDYMFSIEPAGAPAFPPYDTIGMVIALETDDQNLDVNSNDYKVFVHIPTGETIRYDDLDDREEVRVFEDYNNTEMTNRIISRWSETEHHNPPQNKKFIECDKADYFVLYHDPYHGDLFFGPYDVNYLTHPYTIVGNDYCHLPIGVAPFYPYEGDGKYRGRMIFDVNLPNDASVIEVKLHIYCDKKKDWADPNHRASIYYCDPQENDAVEFWNSASPVNKYVDDTHIGTLQTWRTVKLSNKAVSELQNVAEGGQFAILLAEDGDDHPCAWFDTSKDWKAYLEIDYEIIDCVDFDNLSEFVNYWLLSCSGPGWCEGYDYDESGKVNFIDFAFFAEHWLQSVLLPEEFEEGFETGDFSANPWQHSGNADWVIVSDIFYEGSYASKSGTISHSQNSTLEITLDTNFENISFYRKVSSESNYDYLRFYIDGVEQNSWSGTQDWTQQTYTVTPGEHTFKWSYTKDSSVSNGSDCGWIDEITLY